MILTNLIFIFQKHLKLTPSLLPSILEVIVIVEIEVILLVYVLNA
jgi:hypothetical protein